MAKFNDNWDDTPAKILSTASQQVVTPVVVAANPNILAESMATTAKAQASVGLSQVAVESKIVDTQLKTQEEPWMKSYWRPSMAFLYMAICAFDFIIFPALTMFLPVIEKSFGISIGYTPWVPLTLSNGGLIHLAFGGILGISAWTRGQEKIAALGNN
jgi:hypothetical protein